MKRLFSITFIATLVVLLGFSVFAAEQKQGKKVTISIAGWGPGEETFKPSWAMFKQAFEAENPNITLNLIGIPYENLRQQLIVQAQSGTAPDLAQVDSAIDLELAALAFLQPLDNLLTTEVKRQLIPALLEASKYKGKIYAVPQSPVPYVLYCSKYLGGKAGVKKSPETVDELTKQATAIAKLGTDENGNRIWGFSPDTARWIVGAYDFLPFFYNFGADEFDSNGKTAINSKNAVAALKWYQELTKAGVLGPPGSDVREMRNLFSKDQLGFYVDNPGGRGIIRDQSGLGKDFDEHYQITVFPKKNRPENWSIYYAHTFVMFKGTKNPEAAAKFLNFYVTHPDIQKKYYSDTGQLPPTNAALTDPAYSDYFSKTVMAQASHVKRPFGLRPDKHGELVDILAIAVQTVVVGGTDPQAALDDAAKQMKELLGE
jgi:ABC-type glycerol-3-phosphate transport system substrate-binding protein